jgi:dihydrofolate reductase
MGRNTWQSIPEKHRPLPERRNIILTRDQSLPNVFGTNESTESRAAAATAQVQYCDSFDGAVQIAQTEASGAKCFVIGGAKVYEQALVHEGCNHLYLTQIKATFECDVFFPSFEDKFSLLSETEELEENGVRFSFQVYKRNTARH